MRHSTAIAEEQKMRKRPSHDSIRELSRDFVSGLHAKIRSAKSSIQPSEKEE